MDTAKLVDDLLVTMEYQAEQSPRSCFVVFSSREDHVEIVIDCIESVFQESGKYQVVRLDQRLKSGDSQYEELTELLSSCCFAVVVLDGFRPNVLFEYGILKGLHKPCIVLVEDTATVDISGFFSGDIQDLPDAPKISMDRHFSDVKDRFHLRYNRNSPKQIRAMLQTEYGKLEEQIEYEFLHSMFPHKEIVEKELKANLDQIVAVFTKRTDDVDGTEIAAIDLACSQVERIAEEHGVVLPPRYFSTLARTYAKINAADKAVATIDKGLSGDQDDALLLADKSYILRIAGKLEEALTALEGAIKIRPTAEFLWHNKALMLESLGRMDDAVRCYKKVITLDSGCPTLHYHYGIALYEQDDFDSALAEFNKALEISPEDTVFLLWKARALDSSDQSNQARQIIENIIEVDSTNADAWFVLGRIEDDEAAALECFRKAVQLDPQHGGALCSSAAQLSNLGNYDEALDIFSEIHKVCSRHESCPTLIFNMCTTLEHLGCTEDAVAACEKVLARDTQNPGALHAKARCFARLGKYADAQEIFTRLLATTPQDAEVLYNQACTFAFAEKSHEAVQSIQKAIALDPKWRESAKNDADLSSLRGTRVYREAFGKARGSSSAKITGKKKVSKKGRVRPTRTSKTTK